MNNRGKDEFTLDVLNCNLSKCINHINERSDICNIIVCADDESRKKMFTLKLRQDLNVLDSSIYEKSEIPDEYIDFYILSHATEIYMVPKFSSFATTSSLLGKSLLYSFFEENETSLYRYKANVVLLK